jgi:predicted RNA binding protein YcfA (HicA-like mRNA interferase family)
MPRKIRQLIKDLSKAGFVNRGGKGSHRNFIHDASGAHVVISGQEGSDAKPYQERDVREGISIAKLANE